MRIRMSTVFFGLFGFLVIQGESRAAFDVTMWDLQTSVQFFGSPFQQNFELISDVSNPWNYTSLSTLNTGLDRSQATYDYSWLRAYGTGEFRTGITHAIRSPEVRTVSSGQIFILPTEDIRVTIDAMLNYSHTPGDDVGINFSFGIRDPATSEYLLLENRRGGNLYLLPSSGNLVISREIILPAGTNYRFVYGLDCSNVADQLPTGIINATGHANFSIAPVIPEPTTLALLALSLPIMARRRVRPH